MWSSFAFDCSPISSEASDKSPLLPLWLNYLQHYWFLRFQVSSSLVPVWQILTFPLSFWMRKRKTQWPSLWSILPWILRSVKPTVHSYPLLPSKTKSLSRTNSYPNLIMLWPVEKTSSGSYVGNIPWPFSIMLPWVTQVYFAFTQSYPKCVIQ